MEQVTKRPLSFIDLFCGCGGFSLGLQSADWTCLAAIDSDESAMATFALNHPQVAHTLVRNLKYFKPKDLDKLLNGVPVDVVVGGPPCQGFSKARQADGSNHGERVVEDERRYLYRHFLAYVKYYQPRVFVMENVPGIRSAVGGRFFTQVQVDSRDLGYRITPIEIEAWRFGVPQKRTRQLIIGTRRELPLFIPDKYLKPTHHHEDAPISGLQKLVTLGEAIGDLPPIEAGDETFERSYDLDLRREHIAKYGERYVFGVLKADETPLLTAHAARPHSNRDLRDFARLLEAETSRRAIARGEEMEFPYDRENFKDRYTRQGRDSLCSTIVAHLKKDGLMFIHPTQQRSLTPREAARVQSFPDTFMFPASRTHSFGQIGNAVPPLVGEALGRAISSYLVEIPETKVAGSRIQGRLPDSRSQAIALLEGVVESLHSSPLNVVDDEALLTAWWAVCFLHPHLHPDAALENGDELSLGPRRGVSYVLEPIYVRSGWPVELLPIAHEARRRFQEGRLSESEYYCSAAVVAGAVTH